MTLNPNPIISVVISISSLPLLIPPLQTERSKLPDGRINEFVVDGYNKSVIFWGEKHFFYYYIISEVSVFGTRRMATIHVVDHCSYVVMQHECLRMSEDIHENENTYYS